MTHGGKLPVAPYALEITLGKGEKVIDRQYWATKKRERRTGEKPNQRIGLTLSFFGIGLVCWSLGAGPVRAQGKFAAKKAVAIDIHCHISTPEAEPLVKGLLTPEKEPFLRFATAETRQITQQQFAALLPKLTDPQERLKDMDRMGIHITSDLARSQPVLLLDGRGAGLKASPPAE